MKKINYIWLVAFVFSIISVSCNDDTEMLFKETASERKTAAVEQYEQVLKSSDQGWVFQYFVDDNQQYGGYNYVVKFSDKDSVSVWFEYATDYATPIKSFYDVISYGGPVLTFNTYNVFMHYFATPSASEYNAKGGDFEFLLMQNENDTIDIKGVKTGNNMRLFKLTEPVDDYLSKIVENANFIEQGSFGGKINGTDMSVFELYRNFTFTYIEDEESISVVVPYIVTKSGISFYEEVELLGHTYKDFTLDKENKKLISNTGDMHIEIVIPPINLNLDTWTLDVSVDGNRSDAVQNAWEQAYQANFSAWTEQLSSQMTVGEVSALYGDYGISFYSYPGPYRSHYNLSFNGVSGHSNYLDIVKVSGGFNWNWYTHLGVFVDMIADNSPYNVELDDENDPTLVKLTSVDNSEVWFILNK